MLVASPRSYGFLKKGEWAEQTGRKRPFACTDTVPREVIPLFMRTPLPIPAERLEEKTL